MLKHKNGLLEKLEKRFNSIAEVRHNSLRYLDREYEEKWQLIQNNKQPNLVHDYGWDSTKFGMISWTILFKGKLLDVGCGIGNFCRFIKAHSPYMEVSGIDKSPKAIEISKKLAEAVGMKMDFRIANAYELPYNDDTFDYVVSNDVVEHLRKPIKALGEMHRVVKKGGKVYITIPWRGLVKPKKEPGHIQEWTPSEFAKIMGDIFKGGSLTLPPSLVDRTTGQVLTMYWFLIVGIK